MINSKHSKLFFKARERIIDEIATQMLCEMISVEGEGDLKLPGTWIGEAVKRRDDLLSELSDETLREEEELNKPFAKSKKSDNY